ncbi:MAG TPA: hypothetical protein VF824_13620 [Thermoanaerobaculia bacterium]|jgi:hypothetical protein
MKRFAVLVLAAMSLRGGEVCPEQREQLASIAAALERRPADASLHYFQAITFAACGDAERSAAALAQTLRFGAGFLPPRDQFARVWDAPAFRAQYAAMARALPKVVRATTAFRVRRNDLIPEGIAWDEAHQRVLMGSSARGVIVSVPRSGAARAFAVAPYDLPHVLGLAVHGSRFYAVATNALSAGGREPRNAVLEFDAASGELLRRLDAAGARQLNDVAVAADGHLYVTDSGAGSVWHAAPGARALERLTDERALPGANGLALAANDAALYVAHATGIGRIELATRAITPRIENRTRETLSGIDGLYRRGDTLIGVQNITTPGRVIAATLDANGTAVTAARTLLSHHHPALQEPTTGAIAGDRFLLLANSFVARMRPDGTIEDAATVAEPVVLSMPIAR